MGNVEVVYWIMLSCDMKNREKSLRHVAMVAQFLYDNKPKRHLKSEYLHRFKLLSILFCSI